MFLFSADLMQLFWQQTDLVGCNRAEKVASNSSGYLLYCRESKDLVYAT